MQQARSIHGLEFKTMDLYPSRLGSAPIGTRASYWWQQEWHPAKTAHFSHMPENVLPILVGTCKPLNEGVIEVSK